MKGNIRKIITKNGSKRYEHKTQCIVCGKVVWRQKNQINKCNISFCSKSSYCQYEYYHKLRDPKSHAIMDHKDTPDFYYLLGLICTDGNITYPDKNSTIKHQKYKGYNCYINLNKIDKDLIYKIQNKFGGKSQFMHDNTIRWQITNKYFIEYLMNMGLTHNKSATLNIENWFNNLTNDNILHFLRGVIDGDGSIKIFKSKNTKKKSGDRRFSICTGSPSFFNTIKNYFIKSYTQIGYSESHCPTYSYIIYNNVIMTKILNDIYRPIENDSSLLYMERKYIEYQKIRDFYKTSERGQNYKGFTYENN